MLSHLPLQVAAYGPLLTLTFITLMCTCGSLVVAIMWAWGDRKDNTDTRKDKP